ncbi:hypothetical protein SHKM778_93990 (plasmid) [Streptomyces sp. KM77-8]|uniref:Uncharacterized protein n=1 Tax=Streptomyces haneummycinicus TaxID=3074435 RepID=A0AAT9I022_9ACTN
MTTTQFRWHGLHVPFVAPWGEEETLPSKLIKRVGPDGEQGIGYADEVSGADRRDGTLWVRWPLLREGASPAWRTSTLCASDRPCPTCSAWSVRPPRSTTTSSAGGAESTSSSGARSEGARSATVM